MGQHQDAIGLLPDLGHMPTRGSQSIARLLQRLVEIRWILQRFDRSVQRRVVLRSSLAHVLPRPQTSTDSESNRHKRCCQFGPVLAVRAPIEQNQHGDARAGSDDADRHGPPTAPDAHHSARRRSNRAARRAMTAGKSEPRSTTAAAPSATSARLFPSNGV